MVYVHANTYYTFFSIVVDAFLFSERVGLFFFTSVDCDRGDSRYNAVKRDTRSSLPVSNVETLMGISMEAKPLNTFSLMGPSRSGSRQKGQSGVWHL